MVVARLLSGACTESLPSFGWIVSSCLKMHLLSRFLHFFRFGKFFVCLYVERGERLSATKVNSLAGRRLIGHCEVFTLNCEVVLRQYDMADYNSMLRCK